MEFFEILRAVALNVKKPVRLRFQDVHNQKLDNIKLFGGVCALLERICKKNPQKKASYFFRCMVTLKINT